MKKALILIIAVAAAVYHMASTQYLFQAPVQNQNTHLAFALVLVFLAAFDTKKKIWPLTLLFLALSLVATGYVAMFFHQLELRAGVFTTTADIIIGFMLLVVAFEATRRAFGWTLPIVGAIFVVYTFFGQYLPRPFWHFPHSVKEIITLYNIGLTGMYGTALSVSVQYIFLFMIFGSLLTASGASKFILEVAKLPARKISGGAGLTAITASGLVGTVTGAAAANAGITGPFTIPLMKKAGYKAEQAAAIESVAATGAAIVPPVLGAVAFVMAGYLNVTYWQICLMAIIPAVLYYFCLALYAQLNALKTGIKETSTEKIDTQAMKRTAAPLLVPLVVLTLILASGYSANFAAFWAIIAVVGSSMFLKETRGNLSKWLNGVVEGAMGGARIGVTTALLGIITASIDISGLGVSFPSLVDSLSGGNMWIGLLLVALIALILGCGVPPMAVYVVVATIAVPAVVRMGVSLVGGHFFVFFFAVFALITPPVAMANLITAALAHANFWKTSIEAVKAAIVAFFLPFLVIMAPILILQPQPPLQAAMSLIAAFVLVWTLQTAFIGYYLARLNLLERFILMVASVLLIACLVTQNYIPFLAALILVILFTLWQMRKKAARAATAPPVA